MKLYIDVTQLVNWQGYLTGIPRVINELTTRFITDKDTEVALVKWHGNEARFVPASLAVSSPAEPDTSSLSPGKIKQLYARSPKLVQASFRKGRQFYSQQRQLGNDVLPQYNFELGSKLLVAWGEWGDASYRQKLVELSRHEIKLYQIVYDMLPIVTPQFSGHSTEWLTDYAKLVYPVCQGLISISEHTKQDVTDWMTQQGLTVPAISVIRLGEDFEIKTPQQPDQPLFTQKRPFILVVGTIEIRKNHQLLYYVYKRAQSLGLKLPPLVIVGRRGWMTEQTYELMTKDPTVKDLFIFLHNANDNELSWLYDNCLFSVYPSFYEGWGLPVAESIVRGTPCLASNTSSIPEVGGDLVSYFDPSSPDDCLQAMQKLLDDKQLAIVKKRLKTYQPTSWDETFSQTKQVIGV